MAIRLHRQIDVRPVASQEMHIILTLDSLHGLTVSR